jgi:hypothetical protein
VTISVLKPTVLILGAGASTPFGFLSGRNLLFNLMEDLAQTTSVSFANLRELGHSDYQISLFHRELLNSMRASVDAFLESKPEYLT